MSGASQGQEQSAQLQKAAAEHSTDLFNLGSPGIRLALGDFLKDLGSGGEPASVKSAFDQIRGDTNKQFDQEEAASPATLHQQMLQSGGRFAQGTEGYAAQQTLFSLEDARRNNMRNLDIQETDQGMQQRDFDLSQILGIGSGAVNQSFGFNQAALGTTQYNQQNPWGSALGGAASGAAAGSAAGPWGTVIGGIVGGAAGYFGGGGHG
jgi:hypothetical protein